MRQGRQDVCMPSYALLGNDYTLHSHLSLFFIVFNCILMYIKILLFCNGISTKLFIEYIVTGAGK